LSALSQYQRRRHATGCGPSTDAAPNIPRNTPHRVVRRRSLERGCASIPVRRTVFSRCNQRSRWVRADCGLASDISAAAVRSGRHDAREDRHLIRSKTPTSRQATRVSRQPCAIFSRNNAASPVQHS